MRHLTECSPMLSALPPYRRMFNGIIVVGRNWLRLCLPLQRVQTMRLLRRLDVLRPLQGFDGEAHMVQFDWSP